jgi:hypothetical protein
MSTLTLILLVLVGIVIALGAQAFAIWAACRWWRIERGRSFFRCLLYAVILALVGVPFLAARRWYESAGEPFVVVLLVFLSEVALLVGLVKWLLQTTKLRAFGIWLIGSLAGGAVAYSTAYVARATLAEAFAISSGSMALALIGEHTEVVCAGCRFEFLVGVTQLVETDPFGARRVAEAEAVCPNCGQKQVLRRDTIKINGSDRIVVDKTRSARRWDLVAYPLKVPSAADPEQTEDVMYVHRLVGLPGEKFEIIGGEIFVNDRIACKKPFVASDAWARISDTRYRTDEPDELEHRWTVSAGEPHWSRNSDGGWTLDNPDKRRCELSLMGPRDARLSYNAVEVPGRPDEHPLQRDFRVTCDVEGTGEDDSLELSWRFGERTATLRLRVKFDGGFQLIGKRNDQTTAEAVSRLKGRINGRRSIAFAVRDGWAYVFDRNRFAAETEIGPTNSLEMRREIEGKLEPAELVIRSSASRLVIHRITVDADIYYRAADEMPRATSELPAGPLFLTEDQCFVLGDNSLRANDARFHGPVDWASVQGVARWCYWPPGRVRQID